MHEVWNWDSEWLKATISTAARVAVLKATMCVHARRSCAATALCLTMVIQVPAVQRFLHSFNFLHPVVVYLSYSLQLLHASPGFGAKVSGECMFCRSDSLFSP